MDHDDWVADNMDDVSVEVFRIIEVDLSNRSDSTESCWLTWDQLDATPAWDYYPLCMSLVARVSSDVMDNTGKYTDYELTLQQLAGFVREVYYGNHAFIDMDDYTLSVSPSPRGQTATTQTRMTSRNGWTLT